VKGFATPVSNPKILMIIFPPKPPFHKIYRFPGEMERDVFFSSSKVCAPLELEKNL
jgi:hypothetical protein